MQVSAKIAELIQFKRHCPNLERLLDLQSDLANLEPERRKLAATQAELELAHERLAAALTERDYQRIARLATACEQLARDVVRINQTIRSIEPAADAVQDAAFLARCRAEETAILAYEQEENMAREAWARMSEAKQAFVMTGCYDQVSSEPLPHLESGILAIIVQLPDPECRDCDIKYSPGVVLYESTPPGVWWVAQKDYSTVGFGRVKASELYGFE